jgi:hypothetical protein
LRLLVEDQFGKWVSNFKPEALTRSAVHALPSGDDGYSVGFCSPRCFFESVRMSEYIYMLNIKFGYHLTWKKRKVTGPKIGAPFSNLDSLEAWVYLGMLLFLDVVQAVVEGDSAQKLLLQSMKDEARAGVPTAIQPHRE